MRAIKYRELKQLYEAEGADKTCRRLGAALESKELKPEDFSIKEIAEATLGVDRVKALNRARVRRSWRPATAWTSPPFPTSRVN